MKSLVWKLVLIVCGVALLFSPHESRARERRISCSSIDSNYNFCQVHIRGPVALVQQQSSKPCIEGQSWGYDREGIWVDHGCRGIFAIAGPGGYHRDREDWFGCEPGDWAPPPFHGREPLRERVICGSENREFNQCRVDIRGPVRVVRVFSSSPCIEGQSWGYDRRGIWVDRGCRAEFEVIAESPWGGNQGGRWEY